MINKNLNIINEQKPLAYLKPGQKGQLAYIDGGEKNEEAAGGFRPQAWKRDLGKKCLFQ